MSQLILVRHGQSLWNKANLFTGWVNVPLSKKGREEATQAGKVLADIPFDIIFTSSLMRAQQTTMLILSEHHSEATPIITTEDPSLEEWSSIHSETTINNCLFVHTNARLNERYYGDLQGLNKDEAREEFGEAQVKQWRRSFDVPPPNGESLKMTAERTLPYFDDNILPYLNAGKNVLVSAHGNSLRSIIMHIEKMTREEILEFELATGKPRIYNVENAQYELVKQY